jgi:hypothetical protein
MEISKLSDRKIQLTSNIGIYFDNEKIDDIELKLVYTFDNDQKVYNTFIKDRLYNKISMKFGIKKRFIKFNFVPSNKEKIFLNMVNKIVFSDYNWYLCHKSKKRDSKIKLLLDEKGTDTKPYR